MEWLLALTLLWGMLEEASAPYNEALIAEAARIEAVYQSLVEEESAMYASRDHAEQAIGSSWTAFPSTVYQGDAFLLRAAEPQLVAWNGKEIELIQFGTGYYAIMPVPTDMKPGAYAVGELEITVLDKSFNTQYLQVTEEQEAMRRNTERIAEDQIKIDAARSQSEPRFLFTEPFVLPTEGRRSTPFGFTRYINGKLSGSHRAIDIAAPQGTPILAAAAGKVVLSEELYLTGNSIYIDHGMGLFSQYAHLYELHVEPGDDVEAGQVIGLVGTTGFSTGPHLHLAFWLHGVQVNPDLFIDSSPFYWRE